jgi:hypothetical protein
VIGCCLEAIERILTNVIRTNQQERQRLTEPLNHSVFLYVLVAMWAHSWLYIIDSSDIGPRKLDNWKQRGQRI